MRNKNKRIKFALFILILPLNIISQQITFNNYTVDDGLAQSVVKCIIQDSEGFIWFGTQDRLNRFNGYAFIKYANNPIDTNSLSNNWIYSLTEDEQERQLTKIFYNWKGEGEQIDDVMVIGIRI